MSDLSIIVVNWNTRGLLAECLESGVRCQVSGFSEQRRENLTTDPSLLSPDPGLLTTEIFVVDNASTDGSPEMVAKRFPWVRLIRNRENVGFARANNQAIALAQGRYVLLLNSDAQLTPGALEAMIGCLDADPQAGIAGVCQVYPDGRRQFCYGRFPTLWREARTLFGLHRWDLTPFDTLRAPRQVDWVSGACLMARRAMLDQIGLLDESFFMFGEEVDLCLRATQAGWKVLLVPAAPIIHAQAGSTGKTPERILRLYRGKLRYANKHLGATATKGLRLLMLVSAFGKRIGFGVASLVKPYLVPQWRLWAQVSGEISRGIHEERI